jgi:hypothetical protein
MDFASNKTRTSAGKVKLSLFCSRCVYVHAAHVSPCVLLGRQSKAKRAKSSVVDGWRALSCFYFRHITILPPSGARRTLFVWGQVHSEMVRYMNRVLNYRCARPKRARWHFNLWVSLARTVCHLHILALELELRFKGVNLQWIATFCY